MRKLYGLLLIVCASIAPMQHLFSQTVLTIDNTAISAEEFKRIYLRNRQETQITKQSLDEYMELFINFKLKVMEAEQLGLNKTEAFKTEYEGYKKQLSKSYLVDRNITDALVKEAYERMKEEINASHILIKLDYNSSPADTLLAYEKALKIRSRIVAGESFDVLARETSDDPRAKFDGGALGWFSAFRMVYAFESAAYALKVGSISQPVRTQFGYHIIKVNDRKPDRGQIHAGHIMVFAPQNADAKSDSLALNKITSVYQSLMKGENFENLAKQFSEDTHTGKNGGDLGWFGPGRYVQEFETVAFNLQTPGQFSKPVRSPAGYHIIKFYERKSLAPFEKMEVELKAKIARDSRSELSKEALIKRLQKEYNFQTISSTDALIPYLTDEVFTGKWNADSLALLNCTLFTYASKSYKCNEFAKYIKANGVNYNKMPFDALLKNMLNNAVQDALLNYEEQQLENKYPDFKFLLKEYHDGIILFELTDSLVWSAAINDSIGLQNFYKRVQNNYMWPKGIEAVLFNYTNEADIPVIEKAISKFKRTQLTVNEITDAIAAEGISSVKTKEQAIYAKGDHVLIDKILDEPLLQSNKTVVFSDEKILVVIMQVLNERPKEFEAVRGQVISDYQDYLDAEWIKTLRKKHKIKIDKDVLYSIQ